MSLFKYIPPASKEKPVLALGSSVRYSGSKYICMFLGVYEGNNLLFNEKEGVFAAVPEHCLSTPGYWCHVE